MREIWIHFCNHFRELMYFRGLKCEQKYLGCLNKSFCPGPIIRNSMVLNHSSNMLAYLRGLKNGKIYLGCLNKSFCPKPNTGTR